MALTVTTVKNPFVPKFVSCVEVTFGATYTKEGETFKPSNAGLQDFEFVFPIIINGDEAEESELFQADVYYSKEKLHLINVKTGKELAEGKKTAKVKALVLCFGKSRAK